MGILFDINVPPQLSLHNQQEVRKLGFFSPIPSILNEESATYLTDVPIQERQAT